MPRTKDGFHWTHAHVMRGLETDAVMPSSIIVRDEYDVIVVGAGFTGLVAARDLCQTYGLRVLIVEGRDRIGGRAWTANVDGEEFEMGGNWVRFGPLESYRASLPVPRKSHLLPVFASCPMRVLLTG